MDLFKKSCIVIMFFCAHITMHAKLTKSEEMQVMLLKNHLRRLQDRSQRAPIPAFYRNNVAVVVKKLEQLEKKDPESHFVEDVTPYIKNIHYAAGAAAPAKKTASSLETLKPSQATGKRAELLKKQGEALKELQEHIALLQDTEKTWGGDGKHRDAWKEKALELLKKPELIGITLDNQLNVSSSLCDVIVNRYNYLILQANAQRNKESVEALKE